MKETVRLDKYLADMGIGTRTEIKAYVKAGRICVNGQTAKNSDERVHVSKDEVFFDGRRVNYQSYEYYMLNKPQGVVSAVIDNTCTTVIDIIVEGNSERALESRRDLFPVGRLDKDTEGLLLITNDGELSHRLLSPKKKVGKSYYAKIKGKVSERDVKVFQTGIALEDDFTTLPAELRILSVQESSKEDGDSFETDIEITIYEGKFHQVKRMFQAVGKEVIYLKRLSMGSLKLDENLKPGEFRTLTKEEVTELG